MHNFCKPKGMGATIVSSRKLDTYTLGFLLFITRGTVQDKVVSKQFLLLCLSPGSMSNLSEKVGSENYQKLIITRVLQIGA